MSNAPKAPKRLRIKQHCNILDLPKKGQMMKAGLYVLNQNIDEVTALRLAQPDMQHCVEILSDEPPPEQLAEIGTAPQPDPSFTYVERIRAQAEAERAERWQRQHSRTVPPNEGEPK